MIRKAEDSPSPLQSSNRGPLAGGDAPRRAGPREIVGRSPAMSAMLDWVGRAACSELAVLVRGETGSGKESVARLIHLRSTRSDGPFIACNCTALVESLLEAELFGATRGAYTGSFRDRRGLFELADGGTLLLDEVGDMSTSMQAKLLRVLEEKCVRPVGGEHDMPIDVRVVAATHRDLDRLVHEGRFRADLYYRLAVLEITVPPLRERLADLPLLVDSLAPRLARETGCAELSLTRDAWYALYEHSWPGNVRELHAALARALLRSGGQTIDAHHLGRLARGNGRAAGDTASASGLERRMIECVLREKDGSIAAAAREIGWTRQKLYRRMRSLDIRRPDGSAHALSRQP